MKAKSTRGRPESDRSAVSAAPCYVFQYMDSSNMDGLADAQ